MPLRWTELRETGAATSEWLQVIQDLASRIPYGKRESRRVSFTLLFYSRWWNRTYTVRCRLADLHHYVNISNTRRLKWNKCLSRNCYRENGFHYCVMLWNSGLREVLAVYDCECMCVWERFSLCEQLDLIIFTDVEEVWQKDWLYYEGFGFLMIYRNSSITS